VSKVDIEALKAQSRGLRGTIGAELQNPEDAFSQDAATLLKFHGIYQQDDRDVRKAARESGAAKEHSFMVRTKNPGGLIPAATYLAVDRLSDRYANHTIRVTTRQGLQLHGVSKKSLKTVIADINAHLGSTLGACGDINRNVMAPPFPFASAAYRIAREAASAIADLLTPRTSGYYEIWQEGEIVYSAEPQRDPIYGATYLPRKFKIAVTVPGDNSVDLYANDIGVVPILDRHGALLGYDLTAGGGLGSTHNKPETYPRLADEFAFVLPHQMLEAVRAIVAVQRDHGDRTNRRHARLKYLIADRGLEWFRESVEAQAGFLFEAWRPLPAWTVPRHLGWNEQGDGRLFYGLPVLSGRIRDDGDVRTKTALRKILERFALDIHATPDQNLLLVDIAPRDRGAIERILSEHGLGDPNGIPELQKLALACPALPTCGQALAEAERVLPQLLDEIARELTAAGLENEPLSVRLTGCPNACARPSLAEIGIIGVSLDRYNVYLGGNPSSTRLNRLFAEKIPLRDIPALLRPLFEEFRAGRKLHESFGDYCERASGGRIAGERVAGTANRA
jgi:sulfite reductase (ferredoxin)